LEFNSRRILPALKALLVVNQPELIGADFIAQPCLASERQWEYACRAGTTSTFSTGETILANQANFDGNYSFRKVDGKHEDRNRSVPVASFDPNAWGFFKCTAMCGNGVAMFIKKLPTAMKLRLV
jgi:Sulfatase-modifying factor enzyme 1